ncbi:unnamed protein product [Bursaphelenchus xylophilus]|uniref:(pine wood nematode) hypothetical protein n=1 Tax=Bursaphelenchus xylophilus TaxID=6326 RepID=A0A811JX80_BURXY|nr:unnamed protein product [Bursaphelenchus xylophilus]CAG9080441.1 unnamed protein product [Bursaphelenchus xylophilus]
MERLLVSIEKAPDAKNVTGLVEAVYVAKESIKIPAVPIPEKRKKCFHIFDLILNSNKQKLVPLAVEGLQQLLRDSALLSESATKKAEDSLCSQMLRCLKPLPQWDKQYQCQILTIIVQVISLNEVTVNLSDVHEALQICTSTFSSEDTSVRLAVRAAITQMLNSFCSNRHCKIIRQASVESMCQSNHNQEEIAVFMEMQALLSKVHEKLASAQSAEDLQLALDSVYSILSAQPGNCFKYMPLYNVLSTELVPSMLCLLHSSDERPPPAKSLLSRTATTPVSLTIFNSPELARSFYQVVEQLLRLLSRAPDAEPMVLELLRTAIVFPSVSRRGEALKLLKRTFSTQSRFLEFMDLCAKEPQFWPLILSCLEECVKQGSTETAIDAVKATSALFNGLNGQLNPKLMDQHNTLVFEILKTANNARGHGRVGAGMIQISRQRKKEKLNEESAKLFVTKLKENVKAWSELDIAEDVDKKILEFSESISNEFSQLEPEEGESPAFLNTDTAYLTTYAALSFGLRLKTSEPEKALFFDQINGSGCMIYAKDQWLNSIFDYLLDADLFDEIPAPENTVLYQAVDDYDGYNGQKMSFVRKEEEIEVADVRYQYFRQWLKDMFAASWSTILYLLTKFSLSLDRKNMADKIQIDATEATFDATLSLMYLLMKLRLSSELIWVFERIGEEICLLEDLREFIYQNIGLETKKPWRINRIDALCLGILLDHSIDVGVLSPQSLKYTVRVIEYIVELERYSFRLTKTANTTYDANETSLNGLLSKVSQNELSLATVGRVLDELMLKIDTFFDTASKSLNLHALCHLLKFLCTADEDNLRNIEITQSKNAVDVIISSCALPRISRIVTGSVQGRPQIHLMRIWGAVKEHLVEAASSKYPVEINKLALSAIYDIIRAMLNSETNGSTFSQSLFNAYLDIVCFNVCNEETQEHVVSNLATFIEDSPDQLGSGWKPLFGALKAIRISPAKEAADDEVVYSPLTSANYAVLDVFKKYMSITDGEIVLPTAMEFIHCMVHYLQSTDGLDQLPQDPDAAPSKESQRDTAIGETVFSFINVLQARLIGYFNNPSVRPVPSLLSRLQHREQALEFCDQSRMDEKLEELTDLANYLQEDQTFGVDPSKLSYRLARKSLQLPWTNWTDTQKCVAELLVGFIDELCGLLLTCSRQILSTLLVQFTDFVKAISDSPLGVDFSIFIICATIIPSLQKWSRREVDGFVPSSQISVSARNLKQAATVVTEMVGEIISNAPSNPSSEALAYDIFSFFNELLSHSSPFVAGTGSACFRHLVNSFGKDFEENVWEVVCSSLWKAICLSLIPIRKLIAKFVPNSVDLNGDIGEVHVVVKENCRQLDLTEFKIMCHQIFQIESTKSPQNKSIDLEVEMSKIQFNYVFVFRPKGTEKVAQADRAVSMDEIISGLMSAQALLQLFSQLLVGQVHSSQLGESITRTLSCPQGDKPLASALSQKQLGVLVACLDGINCVADEFDVRPALKYLLQKLINGDQPANLYRLSVASKAIKLQTVFELAKQGEPTK